MPDARDVPRAVTQNGIADALGARVAHVSRALQTLVTGGLVVAHLAHPDGSARRSRAHSLTDAGHTAARALPAAPAKPVVSQTSRVPRRSEATELFADHLDQLETAIAEAATSGPRVVLVEGDAGSGRTTLLDAFAIRAADKGRRVLRGTGAPSGERQHLGPFQAAIAGEGLAAHYARATAGEPGERALAATIATLEKISKRGPVTILLDDLHLAGWGSAAFLHGVLHALPPNAPVLLVAAFRREEAWELPNGPFYAALAPLRRPPLGRLLQVKPLDLAGVSRLLQAHGHQVPETLLPRVAEESGGNPLYALAMADALADGVDESDFFPTIVALTMKEKLVSLPLDALETLQAAAVYGPESTFQSLARVHDIGETRLMQTLDILLDHLMLEEVPDETQLRLRFAHPKVRDAVLGEMSATRRRILAERVAKTQG